MKFDITRDGNKYTAEVRTLGWKLYWVDENACGVSPRLAFREVMWMISKFDEWANRGPEDFTTMLEGVKKMYTGKRFIIELVSFANKPTIEVEPVTNGTEPPSTIHSMFWSVKESFDSQQTALQEAVAVFSKSSLNMRRVSVGVLKGERDKDGYFVFKPLQISHAPYDPQISEKLSNSSISGAHVPYDSPVAMGHPQEFGIRANVQLQEDGTVKLLDGPVTFNVIS